jgi:hypothetical protein
MKNQFWAGLGRQASTMKKKFGLDYEQLLSFVFQVKKFLESIFYAGKNQVFLGLKISM